MAVLKRDVTARPGAKWNLVYDQSRRELYVEIRSNGAVKRHGIEAALKMDGSDDLHLAFVDMFKARGQNRPVPSAGGLCGAPAKAIGCKR
jgi:hypothetical protein